MTFKNNSFKPGEMGQLVPWLQLKHKHLGWDPSALKLGRGNVRLYS